MTDPARPAPAASPALGSATGPAPKRVLLIRPSALGDVCRSVPLAVSIKRAWPSCTLDWLVQDAFAQAIASHPCVDHAIPFPRKHLGKLAASLRLGQVFAWMNQTLRKPGYDVVIDAQALFRSGLFTWWTRAPRRIGFADARELGWLGLTQRCRVDAVHTVDRMLGLLAAAGIPPVADLQLYAPQSERDAIAADPELANRRFAVIAPTSRWPGKRWPADRFATVAAELLNPGRSRNFERVVIVGSASERDQCAPLLELARRDPRVIDRIGSTSIASLMALIQASSLVIANDSAALHIAVGFNKPIVALFGPTRIDRVGPYHHERDVLQHLEPGETEHLNHKNERRGRELMDRITTTEVLDRVESITAEPAAV